MLGNTGNGKTHGLTLRGPTSLKDDTGNVLADLVNDVKLTLDELTSLGSIGLGVEESVGVSTGNVNDTADSRREVTLLPDVDSLGGGVLSGVAAELALALGDEGGKFRRLAVTVEDGLVTDGDELNEIPLGPALDSADLLGDAGVASVTARGVDEDTKDHLKTVLSASTTDVDQGVAVSGVNTDTGDASGSDGSNILLNLALALASTGFAGLIGSVRDTPWLAGRSAEGAGRRGLSGRGRGNDGSRRDNRRDRGDGRDSGSRDRDRHGNSGDAGRDGNGSGGSAGGGDVEGAVHNGVGLSDGGDNLRLSVGTRSVAGDGRNRNGSRLANSYGVGGDGVSTSGRADVGGGLDDAGGNASARGNGSVRASNRSLCGDNSRDTAERVGTNRYGGAGGNADGRGLGQSDGRGGESVNTSGRAGLGNWRRHHNRGGRSGNRRGRSSRSSLRDRRERD